MLQCIGSFTSVLDFAFEDYLTDIEEITSSQSVVKVYVIDTGAQLSHFVGPYRPDVVVMTKY